MTAAGPPKPGSEDFERSKRKSLAQADPSAKRARTDDADPQELAAEPAAVECPGTPEEIEVRHSCIDTVLFGDSVSGDMCI